MHRFRTVLLGGIIVAVSLTASARLGDTERASRSRYGEPVRQTGQLLDGATNRVYIYKGWQITAAYLDGVTAMIRYEKVMKPGVSQRIEQDEAAAILKGEASGGDWEPVRLESKIVTKIIIEAMIYERMWKNKAGARGGLNPGSLWLTLETPKVVEFLEAQKQEREAKRKASIPQF